MSDQSEKENRTRLALQNLLLPSLRKHPAIRLEVEPRIDDDVPIAARSVELSPICVRVNIAAQMIGVGKTKLYELIEDGEVETIKMGTATLVTVDSLEALVQRRLKAKHSRRIEP